MLSDRCPVCPVLSVCDVGVLWPNGWMDQDETWHGGRLPKRGAGHNPQFSAHVQTAGWIKMPFGMEVGLGPGHTVLDGDPGPPLGHSPQFSASVYCGQTVAEHWWKILH